MKGLMVSIKIQRAKYVVMDFFTTALAFFIFNQFRFHLFTTSDNIKSITPETLSNFLTGGKMIAEQILIPIALLAIYWISGYYNHPFKRSRLREFNTTFFCSAINTLFIYLTLLINDQLPGHVINYEILILLFSCLFLCVYTGRLLLTIAANYKLAHHEWGFNTVIIGNSEKAINTAERLRHSQTRLGYRVIGHIEIPGETPSKRNHVTLSEQQFDNLRSHGNVDQIIIAPREGATEKEILMLLYKYFPTRVPIKIAPTSLSFLTSNIRIDDIYAEPFIDLSNPAISDAQINIKRVIDVVASSLALIVGAPLLAAVAIAVKCNSKGPVIYSQERIGFRQIPFNIYKFRSMRVDAEADGPRLSEEDDPRITRVGRVLRKYRLDELPQFWNVLKGDMSLVGPRPERAYFIDRIVKKAPYYTLVHQVKPGITSWGMVKFGYAKTVDEMVERTRYDLIYLSNMSVAVDFKILIHTINTVVMGKGV